MGEEYLFNKLSDMSEELFNFVIHTLNRINRGIPVTDVELSAVVEFSKLLAKMYLD